MNVAKAGVRRAQSEVHTTEEHMQATITLKIPLEKANALKGRLEELKKSATNNREDLEAKIQRAKSDEERARIKDLLKLAREVELDANITNLLRACLDFATEKLLGASDNQLLAVIHDSKALRGRPPRSGSSEETIEGKARKAK